MHTVDISKRKWDESNPSEQNDVTITVEIRYQIHLNKITWLGVHVDCICCGCGSSSVSDVIDHQSFSTDLGSSSRAWICDDTELQPLPSDVLPVDTTNGSELGLGQQDLGFSDGFDLGSSSVAHAFDNNDSDFNLFPPSKKTRTS
ncbi:hypothetical protein CMV_019970 [Castanea mollissima]|uniref:Uncharacterized protein n=1 Tax=Castanea mollissima TaxID=60419 RepID=A0A8J4VAV8_9ROSI|nr:hypothetical protein CMV_019970 [Castanea mollissima]